MLKYRSQLSQELLAQQPVPGVYEAEPVEIVDRAVPPIRPARPNKALNIAIGMLAGAALGLLAGLATRAVSRKAR